MAIKRQSIVRSILFASAALIALFISCFDLLTATVDVYLGTSPQSYNTIP